MWLDALTQKVREGGRIVNVSVVVATGVTAQGQREVLGMDVDASGKRRLLAGLPALACQYVAVLRFCHPLTGQRK